jgi:hypothetical protein
VGSHLIFVNIIEWRRTMVGSVAKSFWVMMAIAGIAGAQEWRSEEVSEGTKPELALDQLGRPHIAFMTEARDGAVSLATRDGDGWSVEEVAVGYFYGPLDIALDPAGNPHIAYHDHQAPSFDRELGDPVHAFKVGPEWVVETITHPGHDGWDTSIAVSATGEVHVASIDPAQFSSTEGVEWAVRAVDGRWSIEAIGSGPVTVRIRYRAGVESRRCSCHRLP